MLIYEIFYVLVSMNEAVEAYFLDNQEFVEGQVRCNH
jgi:hypothetical protein